MNRCGQNRNKDKTVSLPLRDDRLQLLMEKVYRRLQCVTTVR